ncbi:alpha/beta fold hydrolase [Streptosporangium sp. NPDC000396]|uniref:alpha/beta fold hydrolase n=1 Tax=Streptosporangium sp. NPDC000396 TaxID=3366185 RepID=UPI00369E8AD3
MRMMDSAEGQIAYRLEGPAEGPLLVLVHGMGDTGATYRLLTPQLAAAGYRVAVMDVRGYGASTTGWADHSVASIGADLLRLIRHLNGDAPASVIAHSIGCSSAVWAAAEAPEMITNLVLIGTFSGDAPIKPWMKAASRLVGRSATLWGLFLRSSYPTARPADFGDYLAALKANLREPGRLAALRAQIETSLSGVVNRYAEVTQPTLIVMGTKDGDFSDPAADASLSAAKLSGPARIHLVEGAGHYPHAEMPAATAEGLLTFLAEARPPVKIAS